MIRYLNCVKRAAGVSLEDFARFWQDDLFVDMVRRTAALYKAKNWTMGLGLSIEANLTILEMKGNAPAFDGVIEYNWQNGSDLTSIFQSEEGKQLYDEMTEYQSRFVDLDASPQFFVQTEDG